MSIIPLLSAYRMPSAVLGVFQKFPGKTTIPRGKTLRGGDFLPLLDCYSLAQERFIQQNTRYRPSRVAQETASSLKARFSSGKESRSSHSVPFLEVISAFPKKVQGFED
jgi:hypothetical protein